MIIGFSRDCPRSWLNNDTSRHWITLCGLCFGTSSCVPILFLVPTCSITKVNIFTPYHVLYARESIVQERKRWLRQTVS
ncbi:hypothetical protein BDV29DRAFT_182969 [Aspergillus leporis]|uniref:Uncharacterized protein n=1 Tax=Aspergillus leporis TaxID=41062 RepID=A0A5N5WQJ3_9EURO|nr:hypothetical protein BDV29DRAFT_182969 [Aspergillus leporis]